MPRYIDADLLIETMQNRYDEICDAYGYRDLYASGYDDAVDAVENAPTADVVPRAEVESIFDELIKAADEIAESYKKEADNMSCSDFARTEYRGTQIGALLVQYKIAELKKKYTVATDTNDGHKAGE
jgi:hypothetical protein